MTAFRAALCVSIRARCAFSTSAAETSPSRTAAANWVVLEKTVSILIAPACRIASNRRTWQSGVAQFRIPLGPAPFGREVEQIPELVDGIGMARILAGVGGRI